MMVRQHNRISTARKEKGWGWLFFPQIELNWPLPYSTLPVSQLRDARPVGWVTLCSTVFARVQYQEPKTGQQNWRSDDPLWQIQFENSDSAVLITPRSQNLSDSIFKTWIPISINYSYVHCVADPDSYLSGVVLIPNPNPQKYLFLRYAPFDS